MCNFNYFIMKTKQLYFLIALFSFCLVNFSAKAESNSDDPGTENYDPDGTYWGEPVHSYYVDFNVFETNVLPFPITSENIQELASLGLKRWAIQTRPTMMPGYSQTGPQVNALFNNNPTIDGVRNSSATPALIYFPTLKDGAGSIRINGWATNATSRGVALDSWNEEEGIWKHYVGISIPGGDGTNVVEANLNIVGSVRLRLRYTNTSYLAFTGIAISAFGENITTTNENQAEIEKPFISNGKLLLGNTVSEVFVYNFNGQLLMREKNVYGDMLLPTAPGIVKVVKNTGTFILKNI